MEFRGRFVMFVAVVGLLVVPLQMALIPILRLYTSGGELGGVTLFPDDLKLNGTLPGVWLAHTAFGLPLAVYLLRNYIGSLPSSIIESARIDGADHFTIFWRLIVPLSVPALAAFAIFQFLWVWNDLLVAYVFLGGSRENRVVTIALANLVGSRGENWHLLTAAAFISMTLPLTVFFSLQRYFVRGLTAGSVKG
jgi:alpha-glucoside transport system permease protein